MKYLKLIAVTVGLMLVVNATAGAGSIGSDPPFAGDVFMHMKNLDAARLYTGYLANGVTPAATGTWYTDPTNELQWYANPGLEENETSFGVFKIHEVYSAERVGYCNMDSATPENLLWHDGDGGKEIVGIFYGRQDDEVFFVNTTGVPEANLQLIHSSNDEYKIWYQDWGTFNGGHNGLVDRFDVDKFETIGYDADHNPIGELVLTGSSKECCGAAWEIDVFFNPVGLKGDFVTYIELDTGMPWNETDGLGDDDFLMAFPFMPGYGGCSHLRLHTTTHAQSLYPDWDISSSDPITASVYIPEPVTMLGLFLGVSGLAGYIRKRRQA